MPLSSYREWWLVDTEYIPVPGEPVTPICLVALEMYSGRLLRLWRDQLGTAPPYPTDRGVLFVCFTAGAELGFHLALGWPLPERVLDLRVEFRRLTNGRPPLCGHGLLGAMSSFGLGHMAPVEKKAMVDLILSGGPWSADDREAILDYCQEDVDALARLMPPMLAEITKDDPRGLDRALWRGRYAGACARVEHHGIPIHLPSLEHLQRHWPDIKGELIREVDQDFDVFDGSTFKMKKFENYLVRHRIAWPRTTTGRPATDDDTMREMARAVPKIAPLRELRHALGQLRLSDLTIGPSGRNRTMLWPFGTKTGRNAPSSSKYIFGSPRWLRSLIRPEPGMALAYLDWKQQEIGIAAVLSGDEALIEAVRSGDPYLGFAIQAGLASPGATAKTHEDIRNLCKACVLGIGYGMGPETLAFRIGRPVSTARELLSLHRQTYRRFWSWSQAAVDHASLHGRIESVFGWRLYVNGATTARTLRNFPAQSNGGEMLRLACIYGLRRGVKIVALVHDALMVEGPADQIDEVVAEARAAMAQASRDVLDGFEVGTDVKLISYPDRYSDQAGERMWQLTHRVIDRIEGRLVA